MVTIPVISGPGVDGGGLFTSLNIHKRTIKFLSELSCEIFKRRAEMSISDFGDKRGIRNARECFVLKINTKVIVLIYAGGAKYCLYTLIMNQ
mgnify:FL=1